MSRAARHLTVAALGLAVAAAVGLAACGRYEHSNDYRHNTDDLAFRVAMNPTPPYAREWTYYTVVVRDKESQQPIVAGEGRIFASNADRASVWDALLPDSAPGTYKGKMRYLTAGTWAVAIQFRRDSTKPLEKIEWIQDVRAERDSVP